MRTIYFFMILCLSSCLDQDEISYFSSEQLTRLLASDSVKSWTLVDRIVENESIIRDCDKDDLLIFQRSISAQDSNIVQLLTGPILCPEQNDSVIFEGSWQVLDTINAHVVQFVTDEDTSTMSIEFISSQILEILNSQQTGTVRETYLSAQE